MRLFRLCIGVIGLTFISGVAAQAAELTLDDCISLSLKNRESIIRARGSVELAKAGKRSALGAFLPRISATYNYSRSEEQVYTGEDSVIRTHIIGADTAKDFYKFGTNPQRQYRTTKSLSFDGSINVFDASVIYDYSAARANYEAARLDVIDSEQDLIYAVKATYYAYLANAKNASVTQEAVKRSEEQLKLIQSKFDLGSASKSDVLKQKVLYGNDKLALLRANNSVTNAAATLAYTIGVDPQQSWQFSAKYTVRTFEGTLDSAILFGMSHQPGLLSIQHSLRGAQRNYKSAMSTYLPTVSASGSYSRPYGTGTSEDWNKAYGIRLSWTIFDGFNRERQITSAKVSRNNLQASFADASNLAVSDIKTAYLEIDRLKEQKTVADENIAAATEDLKITQEKYKLGAATILDLLDAQVSLKQAEVGRISADFDLNLAISKLEKSMGKL